MINVYIQHILLKDWIYFFWKLVKFDFFSCVNLILLIYTTKLILDVRQNIPFNCFPPFCEVIKRCMS